MNPKDLFRQVNLYCDEKDRQVYLFPNGWHDILGIVEINQFEQVTLPFNGNELFDKVEVCMSLCYSELAPKFPAKELHSQIYATKKATQQLPKI